ncbi:MAG: lamin tail domain-containing protein [Aggregatilineales bacterium]
MQRRGLVLFVILNVLITAGVAFAVISLNPGGTQTIERQVPFRVPVTTTPDPNYTQPVIIITATFDPNAAQNQAAVSGTQVDIPLDILETNPAVANAPTLDPTVLAENPDIQQASAALPPNCLLHIIAEGEFPGSIAADFGADVFALLAVNGLDEESATLLQIGDQLIVPLPGCELIDEAEAQVLIVGDEDAEATEPADGEATEEAGGGASPALTATVTLAPTAINAQVEITNITGAGDITTEAVVIRNLGNTLNLSGWTLSDGDGNTFIFPDERRLFSNASLTINTRAGQNTPVVLHWGLDQAVFGEAGDVIVLADEDGEVQATLRGTVTP